MTADPHNDRDHASPMEETARSLGRRAADHEVYDRIRIEFEEKMRAEERLRLADQKADADRRTAEKDRRQKNLLLLLTALSPFVFTLLGMWLNSRDDIGYTSTTPRDRIAALEVQVATINSRVDKLEETATATLDRVDALLYLRCRDRDVPKEVRDAALRQFGVACAADAALTGPAAFDAGAARRAIPLPVADTAPAPEMPPLPTRPVDGLGVAAMLPGKPWASRLVRRSDDRIPSPYPEL